MPIISENWINSSRWNILNNKEIDVSDNKLHTSPGFPNENPILQMRQSFTNYPVIDVVVHPNDDLMIYFAQQAKSIDFTRLGDIGYFGIYYEQDFGGSLHQFFLAYRAEVGGPLSYAPIFTGNPAVTYRIMLGMTSTHYYLKVFDENGDVLYSSTPVPVIDSCENMTLLFNPGMQRYPVLAYPWIGTAKIGYGLTEAQVLAHMTAGEIVVPGLSVPLLSVPPFIQGVSSSWTSPEFGGAGSPVFTPLSPVPPGLMFHGNGNRLVVSGSPGAESYGEWMIQILVEDVFLSSSATFFLPITVLPAFEANSRVVDDISRSLGDYYYEMAGGPLRKEMLNV